MVLCERATGLPCNYSYSLANYGRLKDNGTRCQKNYSILWMRRMS